MISAPPLSAHGVNGCEIDRDAHSVRHRAVEFRLGAQPLMGRTGIEPVTLGLKVPCSTS
jgi:hypothetical protein